MKFRTGFRSRLSHSALLLLGSFVLSTCTAAPPPIPATSTSYDFVFHNLVIDPLGSSPVAGFNLDGDFTTATSALGCHTLDRPSDLDFDQNQGGCSPGATCVGGVDNVLPGILHLVDDNQHDRSITIRGRLADDLAHGRFIWLLRVGGVDSLQNDPEVVVALYQGYPQDTTCSQLFTGNGQFVVDDSSLLVPGDIGQPKWSAIGAIVAGRLRVEHTSAPPLAALPPVTNFALRASFDSSGQSATLGNLGGRVRGADLHARLADAYPGYAHSFGGFLPFLADLPSAAGACGLESGGLEAGLGVGLRFDLAHATIVGAVVAPPSGGCDPALP